MSTPAERRRRVSLALGVAEYVLERAVRTVLDVGCGEALWRAPLLALRPRLRYTGVDPSAYVVRRYGARRDIRRGAADSLDALRLRASYDLVVCADVLHFLAAAEVEAALAGIATRVEGVAYLPTFTVADDVEGDVRAMRPRGPAWYRERVRRAGLVPVGLDCYVRRERVATLSALERLPATRVQRRA